MKNRIHYGEFTLDYWVEQIISGDIELPDYQRSFVWQKEQIKRFIRAIKNDDFIPPITIGRLNDKNIIIDGQQRLTSILLAHLNVLPSKRKLKRINQAIDCIDDAEDGQENCDENCEIYYEWTFKELIRLGDTIKDIQKELSKNENYEKLDDTAVDLTFLKKHYLGFAYIIPHPDIQQNDLERFFSTIFRSVNIEGTALLKSESRRSLYYLKKAYVPLFDPNFIHSIEIKSFGYSYPLDFLRQLAIMFDYAKTNNSANVMKGYKLKSELYYEIFISDTVNPRKASGIFKKLNDIISDNNIEERMSLFQHEFQKLSIPKELNSIIDADIYMFGLINWTLIGGKSLDENKLDSLKENIRSTITMLKEDESHKRSPSALKHLRKRIDLSVEIFKENLNNNA